MVEPSRLERHVRMLAGEIGERNVYRPVALHAAADYIDAEFRDQGYAVTPLSYVALGVESSMRIRCSNAPTNNAADQVCLLGHSGKSMQLHVLESVQGESGLPNFLAFSFQNVQVLLAGPTIISPIQRVVIMQSPAEPQIDFRPFWTFDTKPNPSAEVLPKIENVHPAVLILRLENIHRFNGFNYFGRREHLRL